MSTISKHHRIKLSIDKLPNWDLRKISEVCQVLDDHRKPLNETQRNLIPGEIPYCGANGIVGFVNQYTIDDDVILMAEDGGYFDEYQSRPIAYRMKGKIWVNNHAHILKAFPSVNQDFIFYSLAHKNILEYVTGGTRAKLNKGELVNIPLAIPPLEEQKAIAQVLSDFDNLIDGLERLIAKKRSIKEGVMQELLRPKEGWVVKKLKEVLSYEQPTKYLVRSSAYQSNFITPVLTAGKTFLLGNTDENFGIYDKLPVIIFDDFTTASKYVAFPFKAKSSALKMLKARSENFNLKLLFEILNSLKFEVSDHKRHWISEFANIEISIPSTRVEQNKIARAIGDLDEDLSLLEGKLFKFNQIKQGVLNELLTGKTRLI